MAIIGAGFAGVSAAYYLSHNKVAVDIFEGRSRVGGRVYTSQDVVSGRLTEMGAELIGANHPLWIEFARQFGLGLSVFTSEDQYSAQGLEMPLYIDGKLIDPRQAELLYNQMTTVFSWMSADVESMPDLDPFAPWAAAGASEYDAKSVAGRLQDFGISPSDDLWKVLEIEFVNNNLLGLESQSYLGLLSLIKGGSYGGDLTGYWTETEVFRCENGNQQLAITLSNLTVNDPSPPDPDSYIPGTLKLSTTVTTIDVLDSAVLVNGMQYDYAILAVPPTIWESSNIYPTRITVSPALDPSQYDISTGPAVKYFKPLYGRFWIQEAKAPSSMSETVGMTWDGTDNQMQILGPEQNRQGLEFNVFAGGTYANTALANNTSPSAIDTYYNGELLKIYPSYATGSAGTFESFTYDHFTLTGYSCPAVNEVCVKARNLSQAYPSANGRLFFAGEHTCMAFFGYMEGALESGVIAAKNVITAMQASARAR